MAPAASCIIDLSELPPATPPAIKRRSVPVPAAAQQGKWLGDTLADKVFSQDLVEANDVVSADVYVMSVSQHKHIAKATSELHSMFQAATAKVLSDDSLLSRFQIPRALWPRLRQSFMMSVAAAPGASTPIAGRFDLAVNGSEIKVFEYNQDTASCLYEAGRAQGLWASAAGITAGHNPGAELFDRLVAAWRASSVAKADKVLHLMHDDDEEELYHSEYMASAAQEAGLTTKLISGEDALQWGQDGQILDKDGEPVHYVWKTWAWETVFDRQQEQGSTLGSCPTLADVLLNERVQVWEPLWTTIPNNKAILPVLWGMYPMHPLLLRAEFELSEEMRAGGEMREGYVSKPIVGRCGLNVEMYNPEGHVQAAAGGKFHHKDTIYQELRNLPRLDGKSVLICPWAVQGEFAGLVLRVDEGLITTVDSATECLRIVPDAHMLRADLDLQQRPQQHWTQLEISAGMQASFPLPTQCSTPPRDRSACHILPMSAGMLEDLRRGDLGLLRLALLRQASHWQDGATPTEGPVLTHRPQSLTRPSGFTAQCSC